MDILLKAEPPLPRKILPIEREGMIFRQGDKARGPCIVLSGSVELRRHSESGHDIAIHHALAGESFAEASLYADHYHCDAIALERSQVARFDGRAILERIEQDGGFALAFNRQLAAQVQQYRLRLELHSIRSARERVYAAMAAGLMKGEIKRFASSIGLTHEATYRALADLVRSGRAFRSGRGNYSLKPQ